MNLIYKNIIITILLSFVLSVELLSVNKIVDRKNSLYSKHYNLEPDDIIFWEEDFETDSLGVNTAIDWSIGSGWQLTGDDYNSESHSMNSPNDVSTIGGNWDLISPAILLPQLGDGETMNFSFYIKGDTPDTDGNSDDYLDDYYSVSIMDMDAFAWHSTSMNAQNDSVYWCGDKNIGGYLNSWVQYLDMPSFTVPDNGLLTVDMSWSIESPDGAEVAGSCTDGWDVANVRISNDNGNSWELLNGSIAYDFDCGYGWIYNDFEYDEGGALNHLAPGWGGSQEWTNISFDLSAYVGEDVIVRFAFGSDPAYCTLDDSSLEGFYVDNIKVSSAIECSPETVCDVVPSGAVWVDQFYDYCDSSRPGYQVWEEYVAGKAFNGNVFMDISEFAGRNIVIKFESRYDDNDDGGAGSGIFIDDVKVYKVSTGSYPAPIELSVEPASQSALLSWYDMNESGMDDFIYHNGVFTDSAGITLNSEGTAWAGERFDIFGPSKIQSITVVSTNTEDVNVKIGAFGQIGVLYSIDPLFELDAIINPGINVFQVDWQMSNSFIVAHTFSDIIIAGMDTSPSSKNSMVSLGGAWENWSIYASSIRPGEFGISANISFEGAGVLYNVYRGDQKIASDIVSNSYIDTGLENNNTYEYALSATYADGEESEKSESVSVTPFADSVYELGYDDGVFEGGFCSEAEIFNQDSCIAIGESWEPGFSIGSGNFSAVQFSAGVSGEDLVRFKWFQNGAGGAFYIKVYEDDEGLPGEEIYSAVQASGNVDGWNEKDLTSESINVSGYFWIGTKEFSSSKSFGLDLSTNLEKSYQKIGTSGQWEMVGGNLAYHVYLDCGDNCLSVKHQNNLMPESFGISKTFPNPFNPAVNITYSMLQIADIRLSIYDISGRLINHLVDEVGMPGKYVVAWNGTDFSGGKVSSGVYLAVLDSSEEGTMSSKIVLLK